jgi:ATP-binding cassette subfamily B protein
VRRLAAGETGGFWSRLRAGILGKARREVIGNVLFIGEGAGLKISGETERELRQAGIVDDEKWYVFPLSGGADEAARRDFIAHNAAQKKAAHDKNQSTIFIVGETAAAIKIHDMENLPPKERALIRGSNLKALFFVMFILLAALFITFTAAFVQVYFSAMIAQRIMKDIRLDLYEKTITQSSAFLSRHPVGRIVSRLTSDVETINDFFTSVLTALLKDFSVIIGVSITLIVLSPKLAAVAAICVPPVLAVVIISRIKARSAFRDQRAATSAINSYISERLSGIRIVQLFRTEEKSRHEFGRHNTDLLNASLREIYIFGLFRPSVEFIATLTTAAVIAAGAVFVLRLSISLGVLIAFINLVAMLFAPIMDIAEKYTLLQSAMAGAERVFLLLDTDERLPDTGVLEPPSLKGRIQFSNVRFSYDTASRQSKDNGLNNTEGGCPPRSQDCAPVGMSACASTPPSACLYATPRAGGGALEKTGVPPAYDTAAAQQASRRPPATPPHNTQTAPPAPAETGSGGGAGGSGSGAAGAQAARTGVEVLKGLSFTVESGEMAAITGFSGAGKTTIGNLISRLWDIQSGEILLDGEDARNFSLHALRRSVLPVLQDVFLFSMSVAENISLGLPLSRQEVEAAAQAVYAHDFIMRLPDGYDTKLSEGAANISQGQRQLISFARVVAHNPSIIILDEATSSIDTETETLIQLGIKKILHGRTSLVIAHRLSTIRGADRILVLSNGTLAEQGSHDALIAQNGIYAGLYQLQFEESAGAA